MRNAGEVDGDGPPNLRDALTVARSADAAGRGVLVVAAGGVHAARWVTKTDAQAVDTFQSPDHGPIGRVDGDAVHFDHRPVRGAAAPIDRAHVVVGPIAIVPSYGGADSELIDWHLDRGVRGIVIEGSGAGNVNGALVPGIEHALDRQVPVVITSRCLTGSVAPIYGGPGGGHSIAALDVIRGGDLSARKARLALAVGLALAPDVDLRDLVRIGRRLTSVLDQLLAGVHVWLQLPGGPGRANAGVVVDEDGVTVIDTLLTPSQWQPFGDAVDATRLSRAAGRAHVEQRGVLRRHDPFPLGRRVRPSPDERPPRPAG